MSWLECLDDMMSQKCTVGKPQRGPYGDVSTITGITTTACYAYQGGDRRTNDGSLVFAHPLDWTIILPTSLSSVEVGDVVQNVKDEDGNLVLAEATIGKFIGWSHWEEGKQFYQAILERK